MPLIVGTLLVAGRPEVLSSIALLLTALDFLWISVLVFFTDGYDSPFFPLFLLAALGVARIDEGSKAVAAAVVGVGGYLAAVAAGVAGAPVGAGVEAGFVALFCGVAWTIGSAIRRYKGQASEASSAVIAERRRAERVEDLMPRLGRALKLSDLDGILCWTLETAQAVTGSSYAHITELYGTHHLTVAKGDSNAYPSWWHPKIQRLVLWSCREDRILRDEETVHDLEGFMAVPIGLEGGEKWGAIVLGGKRFDAVEERALKLLADTVAPALAGADGSPAGRDSVTGLPNRSSLRRVLGRQLSRGRALTVLMACPDGFRDYERAHGPDEGDRLLRRVSRRLEEGNRRVFRYGEGGFVVVQGGGAASRAHETALTLRRLISVAGADGASVGFVTVAPGAADPASILDAAARALEEARVRPEGVTGSVFDSEAAVSREAGRWTKVAEVVLMLAETSEFRVPYIGEHSKAVARISQRVGERFSLSEEEMHALELGALLHDLGKIGVPDYVLSKSGRLTEEEHEVMRRHPLLGASMLTPVAEFAPALPAVRHHHERFDGGGYPDGLAGEDIPLAARIVSVADAFDAMVRDRYEARGITEADALEEIERNSGTQFDPRIVQAFLDVMRPDERLSGSVG
jgi:diguanylate cyclase (GGDEF)-like protein